MHGWEYRKIDLSGLIKNDELLKQAGAEGWELVDILPNHIAYMKRKIERPAPVVRSSSRVKAPPI
jgi:hypothetical protein